MLFECEYEINCLESLDDLIYQHVSFNDYSTQHLIPILLKAAI